MLTTEKIMDLALELAGLKNIPQDSGIWVPGREIKKILFGIDAGAAELEIARRMGFDLVIAHHPPEATLRAWKVYQLHVGQMVAAGVPEGLAQEAVAGTIEAIKLGAHARNDDHTVSVARLIDQPFMNIHTPLDEIGRQRLQGRLDSFLAENPGAEVGDLLGLLDEFPEVGEARVRPFIVGDETARAGKSLFAHAALDIPCREIFRAYYAHGVQTLLTLRVDRGDLAWLRAEKPGNLIVIGHMAGDNLGFGPFFEKLREAGAELTTFSGARG